MNINWFLPSLLASSANGLSNSLIKIGETYYEKNSIVTFYLFITFLIIYIFSGKYNILKYITGYSVLAGIFFGLTQIFLINSFNYIDNAFIPIAISRFQVIPTFFISLYIFNLKFKKIDLIPILIILFGILIILIYYLNITTINNPIWIIYSLLTAFSLTGVDIFTKLSLKNMTILQNLNITNLFASIIVLFNQYFFTKKIGLTRLSKPKKSITNLSLINKYPFIIILIIPFLIINLKYFSNVAYKYADNPGKPRMILNTTFIFTLLFSFFLQKSENISIYELVGTLIILLGIMFPLIKII